MLLHLLLAMASVATTWVILGSVVAGLGLGVQRAFGVRDVDTDGVLLAFWVGLGVVIGVLQVWNFAFAVTWHALALVCLLGGVGLAIQAGELRRWARGVVGRRPVVCVGLVLAALWLANQAIGPGDDQDSGSYHYQVIRWANEHHVVPGLANLAARYALNSSSLLYAAMLNTGPWQGRSEHVANGMLLLVLFTQVLVAMARLVRGSRRPAIDVYHVVLLVPAVMLLFSKEVRSPTTDLAAGVVLFVIGWRLLALLGPPDDDPRRRIHAFVTLTALCALATCLKLSTAFFVLTVWLMAAVVWLRRERSHSNTRDWGLIWSVGLSVVLVGPWAGRNVVLSGYPLYPSPVVGAPVDWRLPRPTVVAYGERLRKMGQGGQTLWLSRLVAQTPMKWYAPLIAAPFADWEEIKGWEWVRPWLFCLPIGSLIEVVLPLAVVAVAWLAVLFRRWRRGAAVTPVGAGAWLLLPAGVALVSWFVLTPVARFAYGATWTMAAVSVAVACVACCRELSGRSAAALVVSACVLALPAVGYRVAVLKVLWRVDPLAEIPLRGPGPDRGFHPRPVVESEPWVSRRGVTVQIARGGFCWDCPLPCLGWMPHLYLRLRREGEPFGGFVIDQWGVFGEP